MLALTVVLLLAACVNGGATLQIYPTNIIPLHYQITITPDFEDLSFTGETVLAVVVEDAVENITLDAKNLSVTEVKAVAWNLAEVDGVTFELESDSVRINFATALPAGNYDFSFVYTGKINENYEGLYVAKYNKNSIGNRQFALTNFQYANARQVFPCFDHPAYPATFSIRIIRPKDYIALSNMAKKLESEYGEDKMLDEFAQTDTIPTYLVSFAIIDFDKIPNENVSLYSVVNEGTELLQEFATRALEKFTGLYDHKLSKIDHVIVPDDALPRDVLESVGLIVYRQSAVLYDSGTQTTKQKHSILKLVAHAIAKQSYKNSDTSQLWSNFWLTEGIISLYQYEIITELEPEWQLLEQFTTEDFHTALLADTDENEVTLTIGQNDPPENLVDSFFTKSFALVRLLRHLELPGDISSDDTVAHTWAQLKGYPVIKANHDSNTNTIILTQLQGDSAWPIPVSIATRDQPDFASPTFTHTLDQVEKTFPLELSNGSWYIINKQQIGYFRVNYDQTNWNLIANYLRSPDYEAIDKINRAQLIDDAFNLVGVEGLNYDTYLDVISYIENETEYVPLYTFFKTTSHLKVLLSHSETQQKFVTFAKNLAQRLYEIVGTTIKPTDSDVNRLNRLNVLTWLCSFGDETCQKEMYAILSKQEPVDPDLQDAVYCGGMRLSDIENFEFLLDQHKASGNTRILNSLGCTSNSEILTAYLEGAIGSSITVSLNQEDRVEAFQAVIEGSDEGVDVALNFLKQHLETILNEFADEEISNIFVALSKRLTTKEQEAKIDEVKLCLDEAQKTQYEALFNTVKDNINTNLQWRSAYLDAVDDWLEESLSTDSTASPTNPTDTTGSTSTTDSPGGAAVFKFDFNLLHVTVYVVMYLALFYN